MVIKKYGEESGLIKISPNVNAELTFTLSGRVSKAKLVHVMRGFMSETTFSPALTEKEILEWAENYVPEVSVKK